MSKPSAPTRPTTYEATKRAREKPLQPPEAQKPAEAGGPKGPDPTRYGDWERDGRCVDF